MPQASQELGDRMEKLFGNRVDDSGPIQFLLDAGYKGDGNGEWIPKPGVSTADDMTQDEYDCMMFLVEEWDYGGLTTEEGEL